LCPLEGGRLELPGVFGGWFNRACRSATRAVKVCTYAHSARIISAITKTSASGGQFR
jgi:hypothetical protein